MITFQDVMTVFASLVDGSLCIFKKDLSPSANDRPIFNEMLEDLISYEKDKWILAMVYNAFVF